MVVGCSGVVGVGLAVAVAVGVTPVVTVVTVVTGVLLDVAVAEAVEAVAAGVPLAGVIVTGACSSRKTMNGLVHQRSFVNPTCEGVGFVVGVELPPKFKPEHDTRKKLDNSRQVDTTSNTCRQRATNDAD
jgi:hypothetical protein